MTLFAFWNIYSSCFDLVLAKNSISHHEKMSTGKKANTTKVNCQPLIKAITRPEINIDST
jgi:hypothetical protein